MIEAYAGQLHSADDLIATVEQYGFLPFFRNEIPGFSVEELCPPELWFADDADGPWEWKGPAARSGKCLYGKLFNKKAGFVSREWIPDFANFRRDGYDFDARWDDGLASYKDKSGTTARAETLALKPASHGCKCRAMSALQISSICRTNTVSPTVGALQSIQHRKSSLVMTSSHLHTGKIRKNPESVF